MSRARSCGSTPRSIRAAAFRSCSATGSSGARADELWAIDPATNEVARRVALSCLIEILSLDIADGQAWIAARRPGHVGTVVRAELPSGRVLREFPVDLPASVAITDERVWVTDAASNELVGLARD